MKYNPYCKNLNTKIFDIETTGLYAKEDRIISASFINPDGSDLIQYFSEAPANEDVIVEQIINELKKCDAVITYNGNMFDIPFVLTRANKLHVADSLPLFWSIDVYRWLKAYWPMAKRMESLKQKSVEFALGLDANRTDEIGGGECIELYKRYVDWNEEEAKELILLHNADDVRQLARITEKLNFLPFHQIAFEKGFLIASNNIDNAKIITTGSKFLKTKLAIKAITKSGGLETDIYNDEYHLIIDSQTGEISLDIFLQNKDNIFFVDLEKMNISKDCPSLLDLKQSENLKSGFLILKTADEVNYKECNLLAKCLMYNI